MDSNRTVCNELNLRMVHRNNFYLMNVHLVDAVMGGNFIQRKDGLADGLANDFVTYLLLDLATEGDYAPHRRS